MAYEVHFSNQAEKFLKTAEQKLAKRILRKLAQLSINPVVHDSKSMNQQNTFRVRVGKHRIIYSIISKDQALLVHKIDKRSRVYS